MDLDFIFFPAPKDIQNDHEHGQILWIPKYPKLYPTFQNYVPRTNKKRGVFFKQSELDFEDDHFLIDEPTESQLQPIPNFLWKPITSRQRKRQTTDINSPTFDSNEGSPDVQQKLQKLNMQSVQIVTKKPQLCRMSSNLYPIKKTRIDQSICFSQPLIKLPQELIDLKQKIQNESNDEQPPPRSNSRESNQINGHIPCMYVDSKKHSPNILLYFHANCEDITQSYNFLVHLRENLQVSAIAVEYPGYGKYKNEQPSAEAILNDAEYVFNYLTKRLGYAENRIIVFGRSIGSGPATYLANKYKPACLALMSPFTSLKAAVRDYIGSWAQFLIRQRFDNLDQIQKVKVPTFILHGKADNIIPYSQALELYKSCKSDKCILHLADDMDHISYRLYKDLINPFTEFLLQIKYYQNSSQGPKMPTVLFYDPTLE
ncbi:unnamed protein product [Paramecium pentaurelia]|uniref:Serine aminopeptidase S33 domain-containing protein n=1 Tax=Paramecium pentaurelia TaxID=43138 RepID=A0A8S1SGP6_9CILI|nr:unnamed protein product [Paramecium pentaurelia]